MTSASQLLGVLCIFLILKCGKAGFRWSKKNVGNSWKRADLVHITHSGTERERRSTDMPDYLHFTLAVAGSTTEIRVKRSDKDKPNVNSFPLYVIENGTITLRKTPSLQTAAVYTNNSAGHTFVARRLLDRAKFILEGVFYDGVSQYLLSGDQLGINWVHKQEKVIDFQGDYVDNRISGTREKIAVRERLKRQAFLRRWQKLDTAVPIKIVNRKESFERDHFWKSRTGRGKRQAQTTYEIEMFMVADFRDYSEWLNYYNGNMTQTEVEMKLYYAFVANSISQRYDSIANVDPLLKVNIMITGLLIVTSKEDSNWTESNVLTDPPGVTYVEASVALESFRRWIGTMRPNLPDSDHWMLFTGYDISTGKNRSIAGLAKLGGLCSYLSVSIIEQDNTGSVGATAAHELGHSLSAKHDGEEKECLDEDNYVMSRKLKAPDAERFASRPWQFSTCSVRAFREFLSSVKCGQQSSRQISVLATDLGGGQVFSADLQCQLAFGKHSYFGRTVYQTESYSSMCRRLYCAVPGEPGLFQAIFAMEKTACGDGKWCIQGRCVADKQAPRVKDTCPQGDDPNAPCLSEDCRFYSDRVKAVHCCKTCDVMEGRRLIYSPGNVPIQIERVTQRVPELSQFELKPTVHSSTSAQPAALAWESTTNFTPIQVQLRITVPNSETTKLPFGGTTEPSFGPLGGQALDNSLQVTISASYPANVTSNVTDNRLPPEPLSSVRHFSTSPTLNPSTAHVAAESPASLAPAIDKIPVSPDPNMVVPVIPVIPATSPPPPITEPSVYKNTLSHQLPDFQRLDGLASVDLKSNANPLAMALAGVLASASPLVIASGLQDRNDVSGRLAMAEGDIKAPQSVLRRSTTSSFITSSTEDPSRKRSIPAPGTIGNSSDVTVSSPTSQDIRDLGAGLGALNYVISTTSHHASWRPTGDDTSNSHTGANLSALNHIISIVSGDDFRFPVSGSQTDSNSISPNSSTSFISAHATRIMTNGKIFAFQTPYTSSGVSSATSRTYSERDLTPSNSTKYVTTSYIAGSFKDFLTSKMYIINAHNDLVSMANNSDENQTFWHQETTRDNRNILQPHGYQRTHSASTVIDVLKTKKHFQIDENKVDYSILADLPHVNATLRATVHTENQTQAGRVSKDILVTTKVAPLDTTQNEVDNFENVSRVNANNNENLVFNTENTTRVNANINENLVFNTENTTRANANNNESLVFNTENTTRAGTEDSGNVVLNPDSTTRARTENIDNTEINPEITTRFSNANVRDRVVFNPDIPAQATANNTSSGTFTGLQSLKSTIRDTSNSENSSEKVVVTSDRLALFEKERLTLDIPAPLNTQVNIDVADTTNVILSPPSFTPSYNVQKNATLSKATLNDLHNLPSGARVFGADGVTSARPTSFEAVIQIINSETSAFPPISILQSTSGYNPPTSSNTDKSENSSQLATQMPSSLTPASPRNCLNTNAPCFPDSSANETTTESLKPQNYSFAMQAQAATFSPIVSDVAGVTKRKSLPVVVGKMLSLMTSGFLNSHATNNPGTDLTIGIPDAVQQEARSDYVYRTTFGINSRASTKVTESSSVFGIVPATALRRQEDGFQQLTTLNSRDGHRDEFQSRDHSTISSDVVAPYQGSHQPPLGIVYARPKSSTASSPSRKFDTLRIMPLREGFPNLHVDGEPIYISTTPFKCLALCRLFREPTLNSGNRYMDGLSRFFRSRMETMYDRLRQVDDLPWLAPSRPEHHVAHQLPRSTLQR